MTEPDIERVARIFVRVALRMVLEQEREEKQNAVSRVLKGVDGGTSSGGVLDRGPGEQAPHVR